MKSKKVLRISPFARHFAHNNTRFDGIYLPHPTLEKVGLRGTGTIKLQFNIVLRGEGYGSKIRGLFI